MTRAKQRRQNLAFTLVETMVAIGVAAIFGTVICYAVGFSARTYSNMGNYVEMDQDARKAIDIMLSDIREASAVTTLESPHIALLDASSVPVDFSYNSTNQTLTRTKNGTSKVLLTGCKSLAFAGYNRVPQQGTWQTDSVTSPSSCKLIEVSWTCSRKVLASSLSSTESMLTARVAIRNNN